MLQNYTLTDLLFVDIETVPGTPHFQELPEEWKALWLGKISKTMPENFSVEESYHERASILSEFGRVICISTGYFYTDTNGVNCFKIKSIVGDNEQVVILSFLTLVDKFCEKRPRFAFAGHNIKEFDIPYLCRRIMINRMKLPRYLDFSGMKPWETNLVDTLQLWKFGDFKNYVSLRLLAAVLDIPSSKDDMDGSMVRTVYYEEKNLARIAAYCQKDVIAVANVILRLEFASFEG